MGWQDYVRSPRTMRSQRSVGRRARGTQREWLPLETDPVVVEGAVQLRRYEEYLSQLVTLHVECGEPFDWERAGAMAPVRPAYSRQCELAAQHAVEAYVPGLADRLTGRAARHWQKLEDRIARAIEQDRKAYEAALDHYLIAHDRWLRAIALAPRVLDGELDACREALAMLEAYSDVTAFRTEVSLEEGGVVTCVIRDPELIPHEELTLTAAGAVVPKPMVPRRYWALFRDHVHSCAVRVARETFAALPITKMTLNLLIERGASRDPILSVELTRDKLEQTMGRGVDPHSTIRAFPHRLRFHTSVGFDRLEPVAGAPRPA